MPVHIVNAQRYIRVRADDLKMLVRRVLIREKAQGRSVTIVITDDKRIQALNTRYLKHHRPTDVLAFPVDSDRNGYLGDVVVSAQTAKRVCRKFGERPLSELRRYVVHGVSHLWGGKDKEKKDHLRMFKQQEEYLTLFSSLSSRGKK